MEEIIRKYLNDPVVGKWAAVFIGIAVIWMIVQLLRRNLANRIKDNSTRYKTKKVLGFIDYTGNQPQVIYIPELNDKMLSGFEYIYAIDGSNIFLGGEKGFYHINYEKYKKLAPALNVQIRSVHIIDNIDSTLFGGYFKDVNDIQFQDVKNVPHISYNFKTMHFDYTSIAFGYQNNLEYSYRLKGFENKWSAWTRRTEKECESGG